MDDSDNKLEKDTLKRIYEDLTSIELWRMFIIQISKMSSSAINRIIYLVRRQHFPKN